MSSPGQRRGSCDYVMAVLDGHLNCARCRDKGLKTICLSSNLIVQSERHLLQSRFFSLPPPPTEIGIIKKFSASTTPLSWTLHSSVCWDGWMERRLLRSLKPLLTRRKELMIHPSQVVRNPIPATNPGLMKSGT